MSYSENNPPLKIKVFENTDSFFEKEFSTDYQIQIGRSEHCDLVLRSKRVSRNHGRFFFTDGCWYIEDLNSQNGIRINENRIQSEPVRDGDRIQIGDFIIEVIPIQPIEMPDHSPDDDATVICSKDDGGDHTIVVQKPAVSYQTDSGSNGVVATGRLFKNRWVLIGSVTGCLLLFLVIVFVFLSDDPEPDQENAVLTQEVEKAETILDMENKYRVDSYLQLGKQQLESGNLNEALIRYQTVLSIDPQNQTALGHIRLIQDRIKKMEIEQRQVEIKKQQIQDTVNSILSKARQAIDSSNSDVALKLLAEADFLSPGNPAIKELKGTVETIVHNQQKRREQEKHEQAALLAQVREHFETGQKYYNQKEFHKTLTAWNKALAIGIDSPEISHISNALPYLKKSLEEEVSGHYNTGKAFFEKKDYTSALLSLQQVFSILPEYSDTRKMIEQISKELESQVKLLYQEGLVFEGIGQTEKARSRWQKVLDIMPLESNEYYQKALNKLQ